MPKHLNLFVAVVLSAALLPMCSKTAKNSAGGGGTTTAKDTVQITISGTQTIAGGDTVTIRGKNLPTTSFTLTLNSKQLSVLAATADSILGVVPKMAGSGTIVLEFGGDTVKGPSCTYNYQVVVTTIAGNGTVGTAVGPALGSSFYCPWGITADANGDLYIADCYNRLLRKYTAASAMISTIAIPDTLPFYSPYNIALDRVTHNLYVTDFNVHLAKVHPDNSFTLIYNDSMPNTGIALGPDGFLYMSNNTYGTVMRLDTSGGHRSFFGQGIETPRNLVFDKAGNLYVSAYGIYKITPQDVQMQLYGDLGFQGWEIARDTLGNIYEADHFSNVLRMIEASTGNVITLAGSGNPADVDGIGLNASFNGPQGLCIDDNGVLYVTTFNYDNNGGNEVRRITIQ
jgi:DNA-binding beta-propeller fold protein YncE